MAIINMNDLNLTEEDGEKTVGQILEEHGYSAKGSVLYVCEKQDKQRTLRDVVKEEPKGCLFAFGPDGERIKVKVKNIPQDQLDKTLEEYFEDLENEDLDNEDIENEDLENEDLGNDVM